MKIAAESSLDPQFSALLAISTRSSPAPGRGRRVLRRAPAGRHWSDDERPVQRQAFAGMLWSKQFYHYDVDEWLHGDPAQPPPPPERAARPQPRMGASQHRRHHLDARQVGVSLVRRLGSGVPLHPAGAGRPRLRQGAADPARPRVVSSTPTARSRPTNGPSAMSIRRCRPGPPGASTRSTRSSSGAGDLAFLERVFHKLLLNFTWWVNRKDAEGNNVFQGGFLGLDNIGVFDRSAAAADRRAPRAERRHQLDGHVLPEHADDRARAGASTTAVYEDIATKFFEHFLYIADAMNNIGGAGHRAVGRGGRVLLRRAAPADRREPAARRCARWSG